MKEKMSQVLMQYDKNVPQNGIKMGAEHKRGTCVEECKKVGIQLCT